MNYSQGGSVQATAQNLAAASPQFGPKTPEMEALDGNLHDTAGRLTTLAETLETKIAHFLGEPFGKPESGALKAAAPPPGTLSSLKDALADLSNTTSRLADLVDRLKGIL